MRLNKSLKNRWPLLLFLGMLILLTGQIVYASETTGCVGSGCGSGIQTGVGGTVIIAPTASPAAGTYTSTQSVTLTATGANSIHYTTDNTTPTCTTGSTYGSAISVSSSLTIKAISCYANSNASTVSSNSYTISVSGGGGGGGGGSTTLPITDIIAPTISNVVVSNISSSGATITWTTNESSLSWLVYGLTSSYGQSYKSAIYVTTHSVILDNLNAATTYHYQVKSQDGSNNTASTSDYSFTTLAAGQNNTNQPTTPTNTPTTPTTPTYSPEEVNKVLGTESQNTSRDQALETKVNTTLVTPLVKSFSSMTTEQKNVVLNFVTYGTDSTLKLGSGERAGVISSFISAFNKPPTTNADWSDVLKIANGRWPSQTNVDKENKAKTSFKTIYLRAPDMNNKFDNAAVTVMAYGLRPALRNTKSEAAAIKSFKAIFGFAPTKASNWDAVRAIAYSGAKR